MSRMTPQEALPLWRASDPVTSRQCDNKALLDATTSAALLIFRDGGEYTDEDLADFVREHLKCCVTDGRVRHARLALQRAGLVEEAGRGLTKSGAGCRTWRAKVTQEGAQAE